MRRLLSESVNHSFMRILEEALTFDDVLLVPAYSEVLPHDVSLSSQLTREIRVNLPVVSAAMDTVTEARLAITIAQEGGIGIIHKNMSIDNPACRWCSGQKWSASSHIVTCASRPSWMRRFLR